MRPLGLEVSYLAPQQLGLGFGFGFGFVEDRGPTGEPYGRVVTVRDVGLGAPDAGNEGVVTGGGEGGVRVNTTIGTCPARPLTLKWPKSWPSVVDPVSGHTTPFSGRDGIVTNPARGTLLAKEIDQHLRQDRRVRGDVHPACRRPPIIDKRRSRTLHPAVYASFGGGPARAGHRCRRVPVPPMNRHTEADFITPSTTSDEDPSGRSAPRAAARPARYPNTRAGPSVPPAPP